MRDFQFPLDDVVLSTVKNSKEFVKEVREIMFQYDDELHSYNVSPLFISVPVDRALEM